jgi:hypothetical protein
VGTTPGRRGEAPGSWQRGAASDTVPPVAMEPVEIAVSEKAVRVRRSRAEVPFAGSQVNAERAWEAAKAGGYSGTLEDFERAYLATSRRRRARENDPEFLLNRLVELKSKGAIAGSLLDLIAAVDELPAAAGEGHSAR